MKNVWGDFMQGICGRNINLYKLNKDNREEYLNVFKCTSNFSKLYELSDELWKAMSAEIGSDGDGTVRYMVCVKETGESCGFINYDMEDGKPIIDIAIDRESRHRGLG